MDEYIGVVGGAEDAFVGAMGGTFIGIILLFYFLMIFLAFAFGIASYVLSGLGMYTIAERRGLQHPWLAWLPIGNAWLLGSISDQYQYVAKGRVTGRRKMLLALNIALVVVYFGWIIVMISAMISDMMGAMLLGAVLGWLLFVAVWIALCVFLYMSYYDLFRSCQPSNAVLYLVLSILFSVTLPFFVFFIRKKDLGMPPRKQPQAAPVAEEVVVEAPAEETAVGVDAFGDPSATEEPAEEKTEE